MSWFSYPPAAKKKATKKKATKKIKISTPYMVIIHHTVKGHVMVCAIPATDDRKKPIIICYLEEEI